MNGAKYRVLKSSAPTIKDPKCFSERERCAVDLPLKRTRHLRMLHCSVGDAGSWSNSIGQTGRS